MDHFQDIVKPTLVLDEAVARKNITRMAEKARQQQVRFRPHFKTHQSAEIGEWFRQAGVTAIAVSSLDMAIYFADHGWEDITIAFPFNLRQSAALAELSERVKLGLLIENRAAALHLEHSLPGAVDAWMEIDVGAGRTGLAWTDAAAICGLADELHALQKLRLRGLLTHAGHTYTAPSPAEICRRYAESVAHLQAAHDALRRCGYPPVELSVGDTPGCTLCPDLGAVDEIRPGNFIFYDAQQLALGVCRPEDIAVALACPVVAKFPERLEVAVYGGAIHLSKDDLLLGDRRVYGLAALPQEDRWGAPLEGAYVRGLSQEHGMIRLAADDFERVQVGELIFVLPAHSCLAVTAMRSYRTLSGREITTFNE
ncbi:MAG: alanine racemase [Anaerolineaceae bacterium]|jgi:D-serine deaminase-like pyridoxal phosphate-dependent protein